MVFRNIPRAVNLACWSPGIYQERGRHVHDWLYLGVRGHHSPCINSKLHIIDSGIGIARTFCWTLILEVLFTLTSTACSKRYSPSICVLDSGSSAEAGENAGSSGKSAI
jgi:hypothetical protein